MTEIPDKKVLYKKAESLWRVAVKTKWGGCAVCGNRNVEAHHIIPRANQATRYGIINGIGLCQDHHTMNTKMSPHGNEDGWKAWLSKHFPDIYRWWMETTENGYHRQFSGTTNADYYCRVIRELREYVPEEDYVRIVGQRFAKWLEETT